MAVRNLTFGARKSHDLLPAQDEFRLTSGRRLESQLSITQHAAGDEA